jgi:hypothetical protein
VDAVKPKEDGSFEESTGDITDAETSSIDDQSQFKSKNHHTCIKNEDTPSHHRKVQQRISRFDNLDQCHDKDIHTLHGCVVKNGPKDDHCHNSGEMKGEQGSASTPRHRNQIDFDEDNVEICYLSMHSRSIQHPTSCGATVSTTETPRTLQSMKTFQTKETAVHSHASSLPRFLPTSYSTETPLTAQLTTSYTQDTPLASASTMSTLRTFEHETSHSHGNEEIISILTSLHDKKNSAFASSALSDTYMYRSRSKEKYSRRFSSVPSFGPISFISWMQRLFWSVILFVVAWFKHLIGFATRKPSTKINFSNDRISIRPERTLRPELINKPRSRTTSEGQFDFDADEVGTCVESIVPDVSDNLEVMSVCSTRSSSRLFKRGHSIMSSTNKLRRRRHRRGDTSYSENEINWLSKNEIDDMDDMTITSFLD